MQAQPDAERERCYKIAKRVANDAKFYGNEDMHLAAVAIAFRIKRVEPAPGTAVFTPIDASLFKCGDTPEAVGRAVAGLSPVGAYRPRAGSGDGPPPMPKKK